MPKPHVVFWTQLPAPYMVERFNAVVDEGRVDIEAWFNLRNASKRSWIINEAAWRFRYSYLSARWWKGWWWGIPTTLFRWRKPDLLILLHQEPICIIGWHIAKIRRVPTCYFLDGPSDEWTSRKKSKEILKKYLFRGTDHLICPGPQTEAYWRRYSNGRPHVHYLPHCIDFKHYSSASDLARHRREKIREELGITGFVFICVAGLWRRKGHAYLLHAFAMVQKALAGKISLMLVGNGAIEPELRELVKTLRLEHVVFAGFIQKEEIPALYACADAKILPSIAEMYGYVVEEAMACGLPVIASSSVGEIQGRIVNGRTGYIVQAEDVSALAIAMLHLAENPDLSKRMGAAARKSVASKTPEEWANRFSEIVEICAKSVI